MSLIPAARRRDRPDFSLSIINIVFLLLLFYLATGSMVTPREVATSAPLTERLPLEKLPRPLLVIEEDLSMALDGVALTAETLNPAIRRLPPNGPALNILAARELPAQDLLPILAELEAAGMPVRLVTLRGAMAAEPPR